METTASQTNGNTQQVIAVLKRVWTKLSDREIGCYAMGKRSEFLYALQKKYFLTREQAEDTLSNVERQCRALP